MKKFLQQFKTEDWVVTFLSIPLLILAGCASLMNGGPKIPTDLTTAKAWIDIAALFVIAIVILYAGNRLLSRPMKGLFWSFVVIFIIAALAMWIGSNPYIKSELGLEPVFFSVIFGLIIRNCFHIPEWLKPAIQGEFFIKTGVVCLGATIMISDVLKSGAVGLLQACVVVTVVWFFAYLISRKLFKVEQATAMTLSSGVTICGVSACITAAGVAGTGKKSPSYLDSAVLNFVGPMR